MSRHAGLILLKRRMKDRRDGAALRQNASLRYDEITGQVFEETLARLESNKADNEFWTYNFQSMTRNRDSEVDAREESQRLYNLSRTPSDRCLKGARSLQDAATECVLQNISDVTVEGVECLPTPLAKRIWDIIDVRGMESFHAWSIFFKALRDDDNSMRILRYHRSIQSPKSELSVYTNPLISTSFDFITTLSITVLVPLPDLIKLSNFKNLGILEIVNTTGDENISVGDRLIRSWSTAASTEGAFPVLRILKLWDHEGLTTKSLAFLNSFPALALYDVRACNFDWSAKVEATRLGWKAMPEIDTLHLLEKACAERSSLMRANLGLETQPPQFCSEHRLSRGAKIHLIPRSQIPEFLAGLTPHQPNQPTISAAKNDKKPASKPDDCWDLNSYRTYARIGELRNDKDLIRAGVVVGDQAVFGSELINSVPMASLRLGKPPPERLLSGYEEDVHDWLNYPNIVRPLKRVLVFWRIKILSMSNLPSEGCTKGPHSSTEETKQQSSAPKKALPKRQASGILKSKKRKLEDILGSFG